MVQCSTVRGRPSSGYCVLPVPRRSSAVCWKRKGSRPCCAAPTQDVSTVRRSSITAQVSRSTVRAWDGSSRQTVWRRISTLAKPSNGCRRLKRYRSRYKKFYRLGRRSKDTNIPRHGSGKIPREGQRLTAWAWKSCSICSRPAGRRSTRSRSRASAGDVRNAVRSGEGWSRSQIFSKFGKASHKDERGIKTEKTNIPRGFFSYGGEFRADRIAISRSAGLSRAFY